MPPAPPPPPTDRLARLGPAVLAGATFLLHAAAWDRSGIFRDELYFIACGLRPSVGYLDQPPGIALVAGLAHALFGNWVPGLRLTAWLAAAAIVWLAGRLALKLGGGGRAAALASLAVMCAPLLRGLGHLLTMNVFEGLLILALANLLVDLAKGEASPRAWAGAGALAAGAVLMKYSSAMLILALLAGMVATPARAALRTRWVLAGAALGLALVLPNVLWQASQGYPFLELVRNGQLVKNAPFSLGGFLGSLALDGGPWNALVALAGLAWLLSRAAGPAHFLGFGALLYLLALLATKGKAYYFGIALPVLLAAGAVALSRVLEARPRLIVASGALIATQLAAAPLAIPLLPEATFVAYQAALGLKPAALERDRQGELPQVYADMHGWQALADAVARVAGTLPEAERATAVVFGENYGQAAAVELLAPPGTPPAVSGHNHYWLWGVPAGRGDPAIVIGEEDENCGHAFREVVKVLTLPHDPWVRPAEDAKSLWICRGATQPLGALWPRLRHVD